MHDAVAIVFVATDEAHVLIPALESLEKNPPEHPLQIVVVDNASTDGMAAEVRRRWPHIPVLPQPYRRGLPANLNTGIRASSAPFVMLCNPDLQFPEGAVDTLASFLETHPRAGMAAPKLVSPEGDRRPSARRWYTLAALLALKLPWQEGNPPSSVARSVYDDWDYAERRPVDWVPCPATMVRTVSPGAPAAARREGRAPCASRQTCRARSGANATPGTSPSGSPVARNARSRPPARTRPPSLRGAS